MQKNSRLPFWKNAPFVRLLLPFMAGILLQFYIKPAITWIAISIICIVLLLSLFYYLPIQLKYRLIKLQGIFLQLLVVAIASFVSWKKDERHHTSWYGKNYNAEAKLIVRITEPPSQKEASLKAPANVEHLIIHDSLYKAEGKLLLYFSKKDNGISPVFGDNILISKPLQSIKNSGNPGTFNYQRYAAFQQLFHTVYLQKNDYIILPGNKKGLAANVLFSARDHVLKVLRRHIPPDKNITGIAEALLIGYKEDLDKDLLQAYSNTGVVHIIAISGLHLGLIYVMLSWLLESIPFIKKRTPFKVISILGFLWFFSLLTGGSASVLRSAVMFSCIVIGKNYFRQASVYNSLAASAFLLLCFDPYFLWDVGFQLSYLAIYGIVWLQKPLYRLCYFKYKWLNKTWEMASVTIAAQIITFPVCIFYFHQFPNLFLITNLVAVPLSTIILFLEIFLIVISWIAPLAMLTGKITGIMITLMNGIIEGCNGIPFALTENIYATAATTFCLYGLVLATAAWILYRNKWMLWLAVANLSGLSILYTLISLHTKRQFKMIVYNVPKQQAIDLFYGNSYYFKGDSSLKENNPLINFHIKPARIQYRATQLCDHIPNMRIKDNLWLLGAKKILFIDSTIAFRQIEPRINVDMLIISNNPRISIAAIITAIHPSVIIFDGSNSLWKIAQWKKQCEELILPCFSVSEQGAYIADLTD